MKAAFHPLSTRDRRASREPPRLYRIRAAVERVNEQTGETDRFWYAHSIDNSRYPPDKLRAIRAAGKHR